MDYCAGCGGHLAGAHVCAVCGTPAPGTAAGHPSYAAHGGHDDRVPPGTAPYRPYAPPVTGAPYEPAPPPLYTDSFPAPAIPGVPGTPGAGDGTPYEDSTPYEDGPFDEPDGGDPGGAGDPGDPAHSPAAVPGRRAAARAKRARPHRRKAKTAVGVLGGLVLAGVVVTVLPGELLPTGGQGSSAQPQASAVPVSTSSPVDDSSSAGAVPTRRPNAQASARPSHSASTAAATATPKAGASASAPVRPTPTPANTEPPAPPPPPKPTQNPPQPAPTPTRTHQPSCFLFWCSG